MSRIFLLLSLSLLFSCSSERTEEIKVDGEPETILAILPFKGISQHFQEAAENTLSKNFNAKVIVLSEVELPQEAVSPFAANRYRADTLLRYLDRTGDKKFTRVIGITHKDITFTKKDPKDPGRIKSPEWKYRDWGIFGLGARPGRTCVISVFRLGAKNANKTLIEERFRKILNHEVGHTFGLKHCPDKSCQMTDAVEKISTIDHAEEAFCEKCQKELGEILK